MAIIIDSVRTHGGDNNGNNTVPPGITGLDWCHLVSTESLAELEAFLDSNPGVGQPSSNIRTPALGSVCTYAGLTSDQRDAAIAAGAEEFGDKHVIANNFDAGPTSLYEPLT